jgi:hypothetical protein
MPVFNPNTIDFSKEEIMEVGGAIIERLYQNPAITDSFFMETGIKKDKQIAFLGRMLTDLGQGSGGCDPTASTPAIAASQKVWSPVPVSDRLSFCWETDVKGTFFQYGLKNGIQESDLTGDDFALFMEERTGDSMEEMVHRLAWFADTAAAITPTGVVTTGTNLAFLNKLDGAWKQLFEIAAADTARLTVNTTLQARNAGATLVDQKFTTADRDNLVITEVFDQMQKDRDERLEDSGDLILRVTKSVWDQYRSELKFANVSFTTERLENGIDVLYADGIQVQKYSLWDRQIRKYFYDGAASYLPHRILMYDKNNIGVGTEGDGNFSELDIFYWKKDKKVYFDFMFQFDVKVLENYLVQMAY